jgi:O-antigen/teichoic acid export membrane protein
MISPDRIHLRLPTAVRQGLTLLSGATLAQVVPAIVAPLLTRLYHPVDFGTFAFVLAILGVLAPLVCMRYDLAIMLPEDEEKATHVTLLCLVVTFALATLSFLVPACLWLFMPNGQVRFFIPLLLTMLPAGIAMLGIQLVAQNWSLRTHNYRSQSLSIVVQAFVTIGTQALLGAIFGSNPYFLVLGTLAGYVALILVYLPVIQAQVLPRLKKYHSLPGVLRMARFYLRFPVYTGPYAFVGQTAVRGVFLVLAALTTAATVGQYALAQRVVFLPIVTLMSAASQMFFSRAAQRIDDPRMGRMVRTLLIAGPLTVGPFFMFVFFFGEPIFSTVFGQAWQQAGRFAVILALPSMAKSLTAWLDRVYDIRSRQRFALINETLYTIVALAAMYITLRATGNAELAVSVYAAVTVVYYVIWLLCSLWVAKYNLRIGGEFVVTTTAMVVFMIAGDWFLQWLSAETFIRVIGDALLAVPVIVAGMWFASKRMAAHS